MKVDKKQIGASFHLSEKNKIAPSMTMNLSKSDESFHSDHIMQKSQSYSAASLLRWVFLVKVSFTHQTLLECETHASSFTK